MTEPGLNSRFMPGLRRSVTLRSGPRLAFIARLNAWEAKKPSPGQIYPSGSGRATLSRRSMVLASSSGAWSGIGKTELTLISQST